MKNLFVKLFCVAVVGLVAINGVSAQSLGQLEPNQPVQPQQPPAQEQNSLVGTWVGRFTQAGYVIDVTVEMRADGTYTITQEYFNVIASENGKYSFKNNILETTPEGGFITQYKITFNGKNELTAKGGGMSITYKRM